MDICVCDNAKQPMTLALIEGLKGFSEAYMASAFVTESGLDPLMQELRRFAQSKRHKLTLVTGNYLEFTSSAALDELRRLEQEANKQSRSQRVKISFIKDLAAGAFHPKVYLFMGAGKALLLVGSGNLTSGGTGDNIEAYVAVSGGSQAEPFQAAKEIILGWGGLGETVTGEVVEKQAAAEERRRVRDELVSLLRPIIDRPGAAATDDYIRMCDFVRAVQELEPLAPTPRKLLTCAREGRMVEFHLSHAGLWLPLPAKWFNADKKRGANQKIGTATKIDYYIFGKGTAESLRKLENGVQYGVDSYGWRTRRGVFVPDIMWDGCRRWFDEARSEYVAIAETAVGPDRGRAKRAEQGLREALESTWKLYNGRKALPPGLVRDTKTAVAKRLGEIAAGRRQPWRFELATLPHPVVGWSATLPGLSGVERSSSDITDELADFATSNLRWLARKLATCVRAGPKECRQISAMLSNMNIIGFPRISEAARSLVDLTAKREARRIKDETWASRREQLSAEATSLLEEIDVLADEPGRTVVEWLDECMGGHLPL